jgi:hypothetical protein
VLSEALKSKKRAKKWAKMLSKAPKIPQTKKHVAVVKNINNAVANSHLN